jgi:hypothetical protein
VRRSGPLLPFDVTGAACKAKRFEGSRAASISKGSKVGHAIALWLRYCGKGRGFETR